MTRRGAAIAVGALVVVAATFGWLFLRPGVTAASADGSVAYACSAAAGVDSDACRVWGDATLAEGAPSSTFDIADVARITIDRGLAGAAPTCTVRWYLGRYPDEPAWARDAPCPGG